MNCAIKDSVLVFWDALHCRDEIIHITVNMGESLVCVGMGGGDGGGGGVWILAMAP